MPKTIICSEFVLNNLLWVDQSRKWSLQMITAFNWSKLWIDHWNHYQEMTTQQIFREFNELESNLLPFQSNTSFIYLWNKFQYTMKQVVHCMTRASLMKLFFDKQILLQKKFYTRYNVRISQFYTILRKLKPTCICKL